MVSRSWSSSATSAGRPSASTSRRRMRGTPSSLAAGRPSRAGTNVSQSAASARSRSATRPAYCLIFDATLEIDATIAPRVDRRREEDPQESRDRDREERTDDATDLEAEDEGQDRSDRMQTDRVRGEPGDQDVLLDLLDHDEGRRDPQDRRPRE